MEKSSAAYHAHTITKARNVREHLRYIINEFVERKDARPLPLRTRLREDLGLEELEIVHIIQGVGEDYIDFERNSPTQFQTIRDLWHVIMNPHSLDYYG